MCPDQPVVKVSLGGPAYSAVNRVHRFVWGLCWLIFASWTPAPLHRWRVFLLRMAGADLHSSVHVYGSARVWYPPNLRMDEDACLGPSVMCYNMAPIALGRNAVVSQGAHLCAGTHDINDPLHRLITMPIIIGDGAWVAAEAFVGPGVTVNAGAVVGARAVLFKDAERLGVYAGNPAKLIKYRKLPMQGR